MTADVELLPLPDADGELVIHMAGRPVEIDAFRPSTLRAYTRANVAHATAAKDAEIEALRAEVGEWKAIATWEKEQHDRLFKEARALNERAERLAEALQWYADQAEGCRKIGSIGEPFRKELDRDGGKRARAALHPTAAQENDDG